MTTLLSMTLSASVIIAAIIVIRSLFIHRLPKRLFVILWAAAALRMLVPLSFSVNIPHENTQPENTIVHEFTPPGSQKTAPKTSGAPDRETIFEIVWAGGAILSLGIMTAIHLRSRRELSTALPLENTEINSRISAEKLRRKITVKVSDRVTSPLTYGVIDPVIILPKDLPADSEEMRFALAHELVHIRRFDVLFKLVLTAAACVHWFNPLAWAMLSLAGRDIELSCDEAVLKQLGCKREDYAMALIRLEERRSIPTGVSFGRNGVRERIEAIMKFKKTTLAGIIISACLIAGTTTAFAAVNSDKPAQEAAPAAEPEAVYYTASGSVDEVDVEWWTYDEYKTWLEQQKQEIAELVKQGASGWTQDKGDFIWTQEVADETIALYEQNLEDIKNGTRISKSVNGSDNLIITESPDGTDILMEDNGGQAGTDEVYQQVISRAEQEEQDVVEPAKQGESVAEEVYYIVEDDSTVPSSDDSVNSTQDSNMTDEEFAEFYSKYEQYDLKYEDSRLYYKGEPVRFFDDVVDSYSTDEGGTTEVMWYIDHKGTVALSAVRTEVSDGIGELTGVRVVPDEELKLIKSDSRS